VLTTPGSFDHEEREMLGDPKEAKRGKGKKRKGPINVIVSQPRFR